MKPLILLALICPVLTFAQVQKCTIEGKTVYSDSLCGQHGVTVNTAPNSLDTSGLRDLAAALEEQAKAKEVAASAQPRKRAADPCTGIKPLDRVGTKTERESYQRCVKAQRR